MKIDDVTQPNEVIISIELLHDCLKIMKILLIALALVAAACAYDIEDIPDHMKDRLDRFIIMKNQWREKVAWNERRRKEELRTGSVVTY